MCIVTYIVLEGCWLCWPVVCCCHECCVSVYCTRVTIKKDPVYVGHLQSVQCSQDSALEEGSCLCRRQTASVLEHDFWLVGFDSCVFLNSVATVWWFLHLPTLFLCFFFSWRRLLRSTRWSTKAKERVWRNARVSWRNCGGRARAAKTPPSTARRSCRWAPTLPRVVNRASVSLWAPSKAFERDGGGWIGSGSARPPTSC